LFFHRFSTPYQSFIFLPVCFLIFLVIVSWFAYFLLYHCILLFALFIGIYILKGKSPKASSYLLSTCKTSSATETVSRTNPSLSFLW
jgi:hypothetical protein